MKTLLLAILAFTFSGCANMTPAQQANVDKLTAAAIDAAMKKLDKLDGLKK